MAFNWIGRPSLPKLGLLGQMKWGVLSLVGERDPVEVELPVPPPPIAPMAIAPGVEARLVMPRPPLSVVKGPPCGKVVWPKGAPRGPGAVGAPTGLWKPPSSGPGGPTGPGAPSPGGPWGCPCPPWYITGRGGKGKKAK